MGIFFSTPLTVSWNEQCSRKGLRANISGSPLAPPPPCFSSYISHDLLAVLLLAKLQVPKYYLEHTTNGFYLYRISNLRDCCSRKIKYLLIRLLSETTSLSPTAASRKYTASCDSFMSFLHRAAVAAVSSP